ncbi:hypothetical protein [Saccharopolyspora mangrovi]|uniref:Uncharacterized protein n=1 Tax=Saccharopolyspora mangrovi TaxID=3082379 RepID=A0ABU6A4F9_9PSEU|nr:hypothetical protein [Saccharopolyspora sp. S2-29]MEB3366317.1 hypothetical protein [Saccharopolyspora sp. S2-29]
MVDFDDEPVCPDALVVDDEDERPCCFGADRPRRRCADPVLVLGMATTS